MNEQHKTFNGGVNELKETLHWLFYDGWYSIPKKYRDRDLQTERNNFKNGKMKIGKMVEVLDKLGAFRFSFDIDLHSD